MAEVDFVIGHKNYTLSCQEGEERLLKRLPRHQDVTGTLSKWKMR